MPRLCIADVLWACLGAGAMHRPVSGAGPPAFSFAPSAAARGQTAAGADAPFYARPASAQPTY